MATPFDTIFSDFPSLLLVSIILFFTVFFLAGMALIFNEPELPEEQKEKKKK